LGVLLFAHGLHSALGPGRKDENVGWKNRWLMKERGVIEPLHSGNEDLGNPESEKKKEFCVLKMIKMVKYCMHVYLSIVYAGNETNIPYQIA